MHDRDAWKLVHLLFGAGFTAPVAMVESVGFTCGPDIVRILAAEGVCEVYEDKGVEMVRLTEPLKHLAQYFLLGWKRGGSGIVSVDVPRAFVVMPFTGHEWDTVYQGLIEPAVRGAKLQCVRGDSALQVGDLSGNVWSEIRSAGVIVAEVSTSNPNVYYELGLAHALGKETFLLKRSGVALPADFGGQTFVEYDAMDPSAKVSELELHLSNWAGERGAHRVGKLLPDRASPPK